MKLRNAELNQYKKCFAKIKLDNHIRIYLANNSRSELKTEEISPPLLVSALYFDNGVKKALMFESNIDYGMAYFANRVDYVLSMRRNIVYSVSEKAGSHLCYQWIYLDGSYARISRIER